MSNLIIAGIKKFIPYLAEEMAGKGFKVTIVDTDLEKCQAIKEDYNFRVINGDASDPSILEEAGIKRCNILIALTGSDATNFAICKIAKMEFHIQKTLAWLNNSHNEDAFRKLGVYRCFNVVDKINIELEESFQRSDVESYVRVTKLLELANKLYRKAHLLKTTASNIKEKEQVAHKTAGYEEAARMIEDLLKVKVFIHKDGKE